MDFGQGAGGPAESFMLTDLDSNIECETPSCRHRPGGNFLQTVKIVLIADDNADVVESMAMLLGLDGYTVLTALDGNEAFQVASSERPDAAVIDLGMPGRSGIEVAQAIRQQPWGAGMLLIALTGWGDVQQDSSLAQLFNHVLIKPSRPEDLNHLLSSWTPP